MDKHMELAQLNGIEPEQLEPMPASELAAMAFINSEIALAMIEELGVTDDAV